jgi:hypothetical protein
MQKLIENYAEAYKEINDFYNEYDQVRDKVNNYVTDVFLHEANQNKTIAIKRESGEMKGKVQTITYKQFFNEFRHLSKSPEHRRLCKEHFPEFYEAFDKYEEMELELERKEEETFGFTHESVTLRNILKLIDAVVEGKSNK